MELQQIWILVRRWYRLLLVGLILGVGAGYGYSQTQTPIYQAATKLMVMRSRQSDLTSGAEMSSQELVQTYIELLNTRPVVEETSQLLGFPVSGGQISARRVGSTTLLEVVVRDNDPEQAAQIANQVVDVLIRQNDALQISLFSQSEESLQAQIAQVEEQMLALQADIATISEVSQEVQEQRLAEEEAVLEGEIATLQAEIAELEVEIESHTPLGTVGVPAPTRTAGEAASLSEMRAELAQKRFDLQLAQARYTALVAPGVAGAAADDASARTDQQRATLALYQQIHSSLLSNYETVRLARLQSSAHVVQIEPALTPRSPIEPRLFNNILMGAALGLMLAGGLAFVLEYTDTTLKTPQDVTNVMGLPIIGYLADESDLGQEGKRPYVLRYPRSPVAESMRSLLANLEFTRAEKGLKTLLISSPSPGAGKSTVVSNLAVTMARANKRVLVVDADLHRPAQHTSFMLLTNARGLSSLLLDPAEREILNNGDGRLRYYLQDTWQDNLKVMSSGPLPQNPTELLGSQAMSDLLSRLKSSFDFILIDSPPIRIADAMLLASRVDGVVLVVQPGVTRADEAGAIMQQLERSEAKAVGVVMSRIPSRYAGYYGAYWGYYSGRLLHSYYNDSGSAGPSGKRKLKDLYRRRRGKDGHGRLWRDRSPETEELPGTGGSGAAD